MTDEGKHGRAEGGAVSGEPGRGEGGAVSAKPILCRGVEKTYRSGERETRALRGVDLEVAPGEWVAIMGPSGSGKSTLLHILGGLDTPDAGSVVVAGHDVAPMSET